MQAAKQARACFPSIFPYFALHSPIFPAAMAAKQARPTPDPPCSHGSDRIRKRAAGRLRGP